MIRLLPFALCALILAPAGWGNDLATRRDANTGYTLRDRFWLPMEADGNTLGLFQLDMNKDPDEALEDAFDAVFDTSGGGPAANLTTASTAGNVPDVSLHRTNAKAEGAFEWARQAKVGGGIRFLPTPAKGEASPRLVTASYSQLTKTHWHGGIEGWFQPDAGLDRECVLITQVMRFNGNVEVRRLPDGRLAIQQGEKIYMTTEEVWLPDGEWRHVALSGFWAVTSTDPRTRIVTPRAIGLRLSVNGHIVREFTHNDDRNLWVGTAGQYWLGNRPELDLPFAGLIDEIRVSAQERLYYPLESKLVIAEPEQPVSVGWPYMRDAQDVVIYDSFD